MPPTGDLARNPGMCPDWESNQWLFYSQVGTQVYWATPARALSVFLNLGDTVLTYRFCCNYLENSNSEFYRIDGSSYENLEAFPFYVLWNYFIFEGKLFIEGKLFTEL